MQKILSIFLILTAVSASSNALRMRCSFRNAQWTFGSTYTCYGTVVDNVNPDRVEITNPNDHLPGMSNSMVGGLFIRNEFVNQIPLNLGWRFPALRGFECDNCNITDLRSSQLERLSGLIHFAIPRNRVRKIPGNYFRFSLRLQWVYLHNNQLSNVGMNVLKSLRDLRGIYMANNGCISDNAVLDRRRKFVMMHQMMSSCKPEIDDFIRDTEDSECTFVDETSNENPPKSSSSSKKKTKESKGSQGDDFWDYRG